MRQTLIVPVLVASLGGAAVAPVRGGMVTWEFGGQIQTARDTNNVLGGALVFGTPFFGSFTFDTSTLGTRGSGGKLSIQNPLQDLSGQLGDIAFSGPIFGNSSFEITNGAPGSNDVFSLSSNVRLNNQGLNFLLMLTDSTGTAFSNDSFPQVSPDVSLFDSATIRLLRQTNDLNITGTVSFLVPEPNTLWLLGIGAVALLRRLRSK